VAVVHARPRTAPDEAHLPHQASHATARLAQALASHLLPDFARPVDTVVLFPNAASDRTQDLVAQLPRGAPRGIPLFRLPSKVRRWGDRQHTAARLDPKDRSMIIDERDRHFARRSSSACAKFADAFFRISLARFSSKFSRSSCFRRWGSSVVRPGRLPASRSACRTHRRRASTCNPISRRPIESSPTATDARGHGRRPCGRRVHRVRGSTCSVVSWATSSLGIGPPTTPVRFTATVALDR